jgi:hypothetical protein
MKPMLTHEGLELATSPNARPDVALLWRIKFSETRFRIFMKTAVTMNYLEQSTEYVSSVTDVANIIIHCTHISPS